jgi:hypothetical protein
MSEWFPHADVTPSQVRADSISRFSRRGSFSTATWRGVSVTPQEQPSFPNAGRGSHYYIARQTDAAPLKVGSVSEKFLFYRGVGGFEPPVSAQVMADGRIGRFWRERRADWRCHSV